MRRILKAMINWIAAVAMLVSLAWCILIAQGARQSGWKPASEPALLRPNGQPQLVSMEAMPMAEGESCVWEPAIAGASWRAARLQRRDEPSSQTVATDKRPVESDRTPVRVIHDPNPSFSSLAVNPENNMLVVTDENLFQVLEYSRLDNTPANAKMTEPKRVIGGNKTRAEMLCGVYIDPKTLDTYVVNNDTQNWLAVFSKNAKGNVAPDRYLAVPHGTYGIAVNEDAQEMYLTVQHQNSVVVYRKTASGADQPLRTLAGDDTQLEDPHGVALDTKHKLIIVANHGNVSYRGKDAPAQVMEAGETGGFSPGTGKFEPPAITIYPLDAQGNLPPLRRILGPKTRLNWPAGIAVDEISGEIYVANDMDHSITVFHISDNGDVAPSRSIAGPKTGIKNPTGVALDLKNRELWVADMGNHSALVFPLAAKGNAAPTRTIRGGPESDPSLMIGNPGGVAYDGKRSEILVPN
jgi:DNA-binding beta-propeller fold protein YncE